MILLLGLGFWFWGLVVVEFCLLLWFVEEELAIASVVSLAVFVVLLWWLADIPIWTWIKDNPVTLAKYCGYYIITGILWSIAKYYFILLRIRKRIKSMKETWNTDKRVKETYVNFENYIVNSYTIDRDRLNFQATTKKLVFWATFWPTSFVWTMLNDIVRKTFKFLIHDIFIGIYKKMYNKMVGNLLEG